MTWDFIITAPCFGAQTSSTSSTSSDSSSTSDDGSSTSSGGGGGFDVFNEVPEGVVDGDNKVFTLANPPASGSLQLYVAGVRQTEGVDFTLDGATITFVEAPLEGDSILADYNL